jgi:stage IV sporulation protein B
MTSKQKLIYRLSLVAVLCVVLSFMAVWWYLGMKSRIPDEIMLFQNQTEKIDFQIPFTQVRLDAKEAESSQVSVNQSAQVGDKIQFTMAQPVSLLGSQCGSIQAQVKLFGFIPCKSINIDIREETKVMPVGSAVGLYIHADGVLVLGTGKVVGKDGVSSAPSYKILQTGDYISEVDGQKVTTIQEISDLVRKKGHHQMILGVYRNSNHIEVKITPVQSQEGYYQIGAWLREDTEGIGTLTFVTQDNQFAALGHGITDADTETLIKLQNGGLYPATVNQVKTGTNGSPGEIQGSVKLGSANRLGTIQNNTNLGITGKITAKEYQYQEEKAYAVGRKQEVETGKATILCQLGEKVNEYEVEIEKINLSSKDNKGMEIKVTDKELLEEAGGIVQGMSGSPLIQNGKVIGAVTHVFVKDVTRGYATFIENML